jgi:hypothetical protein
MDLDIYISLRNAGFAEDNAKTFVYAIHLVQKAIFKIKICLQTFRTSEVSY